MESRLNYLFELLHEYSDRRKINEKHRARQKIAMMAVSLLFLSIYYIDFDVTEINFFGFNVNNIEFEKVFFLIPLLITFQFTYYIFTRLNTKIVIYRWNAILQEIESIVGVGRKDIFKKNPYISSHGTLYVFSEEDRQFSLGLKVANSVIWMPVIYVFVLSSIVGFREAASSNDAGFLAFYSLTIIICTITVVYLQVINITAFRRGKKIDS